MSIEKRIRELIDSGQGDRGRLEHILTMINAGKELYHTDKDYLIRLLAESKETDSPTAVNSPPISKVNYPPNVQTPDISSEIESLKQEIRKLQDRDYIIEKHFGDKITPKRSKKRAFGNAVLGVFLFLFGLALILYLYYFLNNLDKIMRNSYYGGDPMLFLIMSIIAPTVICLSLALTSIYYGIRKIAKN